MLDALEQAIHERRPAHRGGLIHHSDRGSQYLSIKYTERLAEAGIEPSVGSVGDSYDNALAETINGLYKAELIHRRGPWRSFEAVEYATLEWVDWFNNRRLLEPIGNIPPAEAVVPPLAIPVTEYGKVCVNGLSETIIVWVPPPAMMKTTAPPVLQPAHIEMTTSIKATSH